MILALTAAFVVAVAPGWFWAATLPGAVGRFERLVYSVGFSLTLTSVLAYVPARVFGFGVTPAISFAAPLVVFASGLALYLVFGPPEGSGKGKDPPLDAEPIFTRPAKSPGLPALLPLIPAAGGMIFWNAGVLVGYVWPLLVGAMVAASGLIYLLTPEREPDTPGVPDEAESENVRGWLRALVLGVVFMLVLVRGYIGPVLQDWPFVQGVDHYSHAVMANLLQSRGEISPYLIYPPGFHTVTAMISHLSGLRPLDVFPVLAPALFLLPALAVYVLGARLWGWWYGALAALFTGVVANGPYIFYNDAMYPNLTTSEFLLVLAIVALVRLYREPSWRSALAFALLGSAPVFFHQVASLYIALTLALVALFVLPYLLYRNRRIGVALFFALAALGTLAVAYGWDTYDLGQVISGSSGAGETGNTSSAVSQAVGTQLPYPVGDLFGTVLTAPVAWLGLIGVFFLFSGRGLSGGVVKATIVFWTLVLCLGAATSLSGFPQRFAQDLTLPLSLLAALAGITLSKSVLQMIRGRTRTLAVPAVSLMLLLCPASLGGYWIIQNLEPDGGPSVRLSYAKTLTITPEIAAAGEWLRENNTGGNIMVSPQSNQVPSRMMLAMGEYPGYQSFSYNQLLFQRDLPPGGAEPLWEVLRVVNFPEDERSLEIIRERDIRYIVLYKYMPDRPIAPFYERFEAAPELYETTFENSDVLIVRLR